MALSRNEGFWQKAAFALILLAVVAATFTWYTFRERSVEEARPAAHITGELLEMSEESKRDLVKLMSEEPRVVGVSAVSISLTGNRRAVTFFKARDQKFQKAFDAHMAEKKPQSPVFNQNPYQNSRITSILNGNFECRPTKETVIASQYPADVYSPMVCSISVPPGFHESRDFLGYLNVFIDTDKISDSDRGRLSTKLVAISARIYDRDIKRRM